MASRYSTWICLLFLWGGIPGMEAQEDRNADGIPVLVRPGTERGEDEEDPEFDPDDPLAEEKKKLRDWEKALNLTADSLVQRLQALAERERAMAEKERLLKQREAALEAREAALSAREKQVRAFETMPDVRPWSGPEAPSIVGKHAIVIDAANGRILHEKSARERTAVASTQKLMTALLVVEAGDLDREVVIDPEDTRVEPSILGFRAGDRYTRKQLVRWLLIRSGNDVAKALGRDNAGSVAAFAAKMNARAKELGMMNTHFLNPHGLTEEGQYSTARDMALLAWECYRRPFIRECVKTKSYQLTLGSGKVRTATNTNRVLREYSYCNGMKTGFTNASGYCLISSGEKQGRERIVVVLGSTGSWVWKDSQVLLQWALSWD